MTDIALSLSIFPVGPRERYAADTGETWHFALQVAIGFTGEPDPAERAQWADAIRPWTALVTNDAGVLPVEWGLLVRQRLELAGTVEAMTQGSYGPSLRTALDAPFEPGVTTTRWQAFAIDDEPTRRFALRGDAVPLETSIESLSMPAALPLTAGALPQLASGDLQCLWYFTITLSPEFVDIVRNGCRLAAWPVAFRDSRTARTYSYDPGIGVTFPGGVEPVAAVAFKEADGSTSEAYVLPLPVDPILNVTEPSLVDYWLPTRDSRLDSLADVHHAVLESLEPAGRIGFLTEGALVGARIVRPGAPDEAADARQFLDLARREFPSPTSPLTNAEVAMRAQRAREVLADALAVRGDSIVDDLQAAIAEAAVQWWTDAAVVERVNGRARAEGVLGPADPPWPKGATTDLLPAFRAFARAQVPGTTQLALRLPGEGLDVLLGKEDQRVRHESDVATANASEHAQIAEFGVLVRRAASFDELLRRRWRLATGGLVALDLEGELRQPGRYWGSRIDPDNGVEDEDVPYDPQPVVRGLTSAFVNHLAHTDFTYRGAPLTVSTVGSALHDVEGELDPALTVPELAEWMPLTFQPVGPVLDETSPGQVSCLVPPLRYGDWYQFAGFVIDRAGGVPRELVPDTTKPPLSCHVDWDQLEPGRIPALDSVDPDSGVFRGIQFLRAVPVGDVNILPVARADRPDARPSWPPMPDNVALRASEWLSARGRGAEQVPTVLLWDGAAFEGRRDACAFDVKPPALDEHTLKAWLMPAAVDPGDEAAVARARAALEALNDVVASIHRARASRPAAGSVDRNPQDLLPPDPAVASIGLRCTFVDRHGVEQVIESTRDGGFTVSVRIGTSSRIDEAVITIEPGTFVSIEMAALVTEEDFARFEPLAMQALVEEEAWVGVDPDSGTPHAYVAFRPVRVLVEAAVSSLPSAAALYDALTLETQPDGAIAVSLAPTPEGTPIDGLTFVDRFELTRQRWVWRNRPIIVETNPLPQSALPPALGDPAARDISADVLTFDLLADLDRGLVDRGHFVGRLPRRADGSPLARTMLLIDKRDGVAHADYLRFGCTVYSRYAGVLASRRGVQAAETHADDQLAGLEPVRRVKRVVAPFRGDAARLKAPKVLAILPLTQGLEPPSGVGDVSTDATPFLIVLDEVWFREYGAGERLSVDIALENREIGEANEEPRPFRVGPLPDHYVAEHLTKAPFEEGRLYRPATDESQNDPAGRKTLALVGPYGYSLDRSGNEAQANATAFIAFVPRNIAPHYAIYVRLRRALYGSDGRPLTRTESITGAAVTVPVEGPPGGTYALYTQPDARQLLSDSDEPLVVKDGVHGGRLLDLTPAADLDPSVARQYRYLLIVGQRLQDFGRGADAFLPSRAAWVDRHGTVTWMQDGAPSRGHYAGRVIELLLNGRSAPGTAEIEDTKLTFKAILEKLFPEGANPEDAPAMIRRISPSFDVTLA